MSVPTNVRRFEALLYASLMLDALSVAVQDRTPNAEMTEQKVHLFLFVKVREGWGDDPERYRAMGIEFPKE